MAEKMMKMRLLYFIVSYHVATYIANLLSVSCDYVSLANVFTPAIYASVCNYMTHL